MTTEMAVQVGRGTAFIFKNEKRRYRIVIGKDTRQRGRFLVCPLGTENLIRVMVEGEKAPEISAYAEEIASAFGGTWQNKEPSTVSDPPPLGE